MSRIPAKPRAPWLARARAVFIALVILAVLFGYQAVTLYTDWLWFGELGQAGVFSTVLRARVMLFFGFGLLFFLVAYFNFWLAIHLNAGRPRTRGLDVERERLADAARIAIRWGALVGAILIAIAMGANAASHWSEYLQFTHGGSFGVADPVFNNDVGFYAFRLPFLSFLLSQALVTLAVTTAGVALIHYSDRALDMLSAGYPILTIQVQRHLLVLLGVLALVFCLDYRLARYDLLFADNGAFFGAGYTDLHARLPAISWQMIAMLVTSGLCFLNLWHGKPFRLPLIGLAVWAAISAIGIGIYPGFVQRFEVVPNQFDKEREYIARDLQFTQRAYGVDHVTERPFPAAGTLTAGDIVKDKATIENIRLWDWPELGMVYTAKQALKTYYRFALPPTATNPGEFNIDIDRYRIDGRYRQVMLAARELYTEGLPASAQTWQNQRLQYTHGYGVVMSPVDRIDAEGLPEYLLGQIPVQSFTPDLKVDRPQIYFGELTSDYVFVGTSQAEFDYPAGDGAKETRYEGRGGIPIGGALSRFAWSVKLADTNMLLSSTLTGNTRILYRRGVKERVRTLAPFLSWDNDPYLVVNDGRLFWIVDGYSLTDRYPYAKPFATGPSSPDFNYIRNPIKAVVDAYDGTVTLYLVDPKDPIARTWGRIFPGLFTPVDRMPAGLRAHIRYPEDLFRIQRDIYTLYHITDPRVYYGKEDAWEVPGDPTQSAETAYGTTSPRMAPYYVIMRLPEEKEAEFLLMTPYTPLNTQNISAWMCARCDPDEYGRLLVYRFPRGRTVNGPQQIIAQIKSQPEVSQFETLMGQHGSRLSYGNLLVIPIETSILYAVPVYIQASGSGSAAIPQIKQVIVASGDRIAMRPTLDAAVAALVGGEAPEQQAPAPGPAAPGATKPSTAPPTVPELIRRANQAYENARTRQQDYGKALDELGRTLKELQNVTTPGAPKRPGP